MRSTQLLQLLAVALLALPTVAQAKLKVVATLTDYAWAAQAVGGDNVTATAICPPDQDAHFLAPRPSYALDVASADVFIDTGLDLELWAPVLLQKAANPKVMPGGAGYVSASEGVALLEVPASADRSQGDVHVFGNPHFTTSPLAMRVVLRNIARGLGRVDPANAATYTAGAAKAVLDLDERMFGKSLVATLGGDTLARLAEKGKLDGFLASKQFQGQPLSTQLGGWLGKLKPYAGSPIVTYHNNWPYFVQVFGLRQVATIEPKPGVPPTPAHVAEILEIAVREHLKVVLDASYFPKERVEEVAQRANAHALMLPYHPGSAGTKTYPDMLNIWVDRLSAVFASGGSPGSPPGGAK